MSIFFHLSPQMFQVQIRGGVGSGRVGGVDFSCLSGGECTVATLGQKHLHAYIHDSFTNTPRVFMIGSAQKSHGYFLEPSPFDFHKSPQKMKHIPFTTFKI